MVQRRKNTILTKYCIKLCTLYSSELNLFQVDIFVSRKIDAMIIFKTSKETKSQDLMYFLRKFKANVELFLLASIFLEFDSNIFQNCFFFICLFFLHEKKLGTVGAFTKSKHFNGIKSYNQLICKALWMMCFHIILSKTIKKNI